MGFSRTLYDDLTYAVIGAAMAVHKELGPGYPEQVYHEALCIELAERDILAQKQVVFTVAYREHLVGEFRVDLLVDDAIIVELKAVDALTTKHEQQVLTYLTTTGREVGLLFNFGDASLKTRRLFVPKAVQTSSSYQQKLRLWKPRWIESKEKSVSSVQSL